MMFQIAAALCAFANFATADETIDDEEPPEG